MRKKAQYGFYKSRVSSIFYVPIPNKGKLILISANEPNFQGKYLPPKQSKKRARTYKLAKQRRRKKKKNRFNEGKVGNFISTLRLCADTCTNLRRKAG